MFKGKTVPSFVFSITAVSIETFKYFLNDPSQFSGNLNLLNFLLLNLDNDVVTQAEISLFL